MSHTISHKISEKRRIGYCRNKAHKGFITSATLGEHKCLEKGCTYFQRFEDSQYWVSYYAERNKKQLRRYYARHKQHFNNMNMDYFINYTFKFYGDSYLDIPVVEDKIHIVDLLENLKTEGYYV